MCVYVFFVSLLLLSLYVPEKVISLSKRCICYCLFVLRRPLVSMFFLSSFDWHDGRPTAQHKGNNEQSKVHANRFIHHL